MIEMLTFHLSKSSRHRPTRGPVTGPSLTMSYTTSVPIIPRRRPRFERKHHCFQYDSETQTLYRLTCDRVLLRCLSPQEAQEVVKKAHDGTYKAHHPGTQAR